MEPKQKQRQPTERELRFNENEQYRLAVYRALDKVRVTHKNKRRELVDGESINIKGSVGEAYLLVDIKNDIMTVCRYKAVEVPAL